jgi:hypothetical protein
VVDPPDEPSRGSSLDPTAVRVDYGAALAGVPASLPGGDAQPKAAFHWPSRTLAARMPQRLPLRHLRGLGQLQAIRVLARGRRIEHGFRKHLQRIEAGLGREILNRRAGDI